MMDIKKSTTMAAAANTVSGGPGCITDQSSPLPPPTASTSPFHPFLINQFLANSAAAAAAAAGSTTITSSSSSSSTTAAAAAAASSSSSTASSSSTVDTTAVAQQLLQNYAMAATSAVTNFNDNGSNSSSLVTSSPSIANGNCNNPSFWDPSTFGSTANGLMMTANDSQQSALTPLATLPSSINDHSFTTAASQLLATISAQMVKESSKGADKSSLGNGNSGKQSATSTEADSNKNKLFCLMCGQTSKDPMEYEQHLISHFSLLDPGNNQKIYQYGMHFLQMQNLLNNTTGTQQSTNSSAAPLNSGPKNISQDSQSTAHTSSLSGTTTQIMNKKRKLLASNNHDSGSINSEPQQNTNRNDHDGDQDVGSTKLSSNQNQAGSGLAASSSATFPCTSCHKTFATEVDLKAHLIRHLTQHPFVCFSCGKGFKYEHSLNFHVKSYHSGNSNSNSNSGGSKNSSEKSLSKSRTSSNSSSNINDKTISDSITTTNTDSHLDQPTTVANNLPLKLKRKPSNSTSSANHLEEKKSKQQPASSMIGLSDSTTTKSHLNEPLLKSPSSSGTLMAPTLITDENHNQTTARSLNWSNPDLTYFYGKPPTNLPPDSPIQIRSEKILISILDAVNVATEQSMLFYKCCLCCVAFPNMDQMNVHMQNVHNLMLNQDFSAMLLSPSSAGSAGDPNHQSSKQQNNVAAMAAMQALLAGKSGTPVTIMDDPKLSSPNNNSSSSATSTGTLALYQCDKCLAKFKESIEYEIHCQLHRTLEMASNLQPPSLPGGSGSSAAGSANNQYQQFQFLNSLMMGGAAAAAAAAAAASSSTTKTVNQSKIVDFRKVLTNCSKNTDFGSKFAAHLMDGSANPSHHHHYSGNVPGVNSKDGKDKTNLLLAGQSGDNNFPPSVHDRCSPPSMLPSIISTPHATPNVSLHLNDLGGKVAGKPSDSDPNNNSLLYLSGIVPSEVAMSSGSGSNGHHHHNHHHPPSTTTKSKSTKSTPKDLLNLNDSITKSSSHQQKSTGATKPNMSNAGGKMKNSAGSGSSSSSSSASGSSTVSTRYIIEPVDIFEGAGQSLPIQKFAMGDIEETAPGQFKCRFCDKTFDRVFSVHRHERVHTGFKPCVCKTCGRGFSEKRNLRHHIIRFHSDGSGRELLKRKRKPKNGSIGFEHHHGSSSSSIMDHQQQQHHQQQLSETTMMMMQQQSSSPLLNMNSSPSSDSLSSSFMSSLLSSAAGSLLAGAFQFKNQNQNNDQSASANTVGDGGASLSNLKLSLAEMNRIKMNNSRKNNRKHKNEENDDDEDGDGPGEDENDEDGNDSSLGKRIPTSSSSSTANSGQAMNLTNQLFNSSVASSSRRRKSKPSKKIATSQEDDQDENDDGEEQEENNVDHDNSGDDDEKLDKKVTTGTKNRAKSNKITDSDQDVHSMIVLEANQQQESEMIKSKITIKNQESDGDETEAEEDERLEGDNDKGNNSDTEPEPDSKLHQRDDFYDDEEEEEEGETEKNTRNNKSKKSARSNKNTAKSSRSKPHRRNSRRRSTTS